MLKQKMNFSIIKKKKNSLRTPTQPLAKQQFHNKLLRETLRLKDLLSII